MPKLEWELKNKRSCKECPILCFNWELKNHFCAKSYVVYLPKIEPEDSVRPQKCIDELGE